MGHNFDLSRPVELSSTAQRRLRVRNATPEPAKAGRPPKLIDKKKLKLMASMGLTQRECAALLNCDVATIRNNYLDDYETGKEKCSASVRRKQFELAMAGNPTMLVWLGKNLCGQKDKIEATGAGGGPLYQPVDREAIIERIVRAVEKPGKTIN